LRLTVAFGLAMAMLLTAAGFLLYHHLGTSLDRTLAQGLRARAADISALVKQADTGLQESGLTEGFAQVLDLRGKIVDETPGLSRSLLTAVQLERARRRPLFVPRAKLGEEEEVERTDDPAEKPLSPATLEATNALDGPAGEPF